MSIVYPDGTTERMRCNRGGRPAKGFWHYVDVKSDNECWNWLGCTTGGYSKGYGRFKVNSKMELAHRVSWTNANGPIPQDMNVLHKCDNPLCVNPSHLYLGTQLDNASDKFRRGRANILSHSKFYSGELWLIFKLLAGNISKQVIAKMFKCTVRTIYYLDKRDKITGRDDIEVIKKEVLS